MTGAAIGASCGGLGGSTPTQFHYSAIFSAGRDKIVAGCPARSPEHEYSQE